MIAGASAAVVGHEEEATFEDQRATGQKEPGSLMTVEPPKLPRRLYVKEKERSPLSHCCFGVSMETKSNPECWI